MRITRRITLTGIFGHAFDYFDRLDPPEMFNV